MYNFTRHKGKKHFCMNCLQCRYSKEALAKHREYCIAINGVGAVELPKPYIDKKWCREDSKRLFSESS